MIGAGQLPVIQQEHGKRMYGGNIAPGDGLPEPRGCVGRIMRVVSDRKKLTQIEGRERIMQFGSDPVPVFGSGSVLLHTLTEVVESSQISRSGAAAVIGSLAKEVGCELFVHRNTDAPQISDPQV